MPGGWTYIMTNKPRGILYAGVTAYIVHRIDQQRTDRGSAFCRRYGLHRCVLVEQHETIGEAIAREKAIKAWRRDWKIQLIEATNPQWRDLWDDIANGGY